MYGGVGVVSAKGTGTNGYVERALGYLPKDYKPGSYGEFIRQMKSNPAPIKRKINDEIILHEEKHKIEVELYNLREKFITEQKLTPEEIDDKINKERKRLYNLLERREEDFLDENETHQKGKLKDAQMKIMKDALRIKKDYYLGKGFEYGLQAEEEKKKKKSKKEHKHHHRRREKNESSEDEGLRDERKNRKIRHRKYHNKEERRESSYRSRSRDRNKSRSRSRSRNRSRSKNTRKEINKDYSNNKKQDLVDKVYNYSPSQPKEEQREKGEIIDDNEKNEIKNIKKEEKDINNKKENNIQKKDDYEHEEGSIDE